MTVTITVEDVSHEYPTNTKPRRVLNHINVDLHQRRVGIIGHNGSGKSTFIRMLNGLVTPTQGRVIVDGMDVATHTKVVRSMTGFLFTDPDNQIIMPTVAADVAFGLRKSGLDQTEIDRRVHGLLDHFGLGEHLDHPAHLLSGGQKQLLALASVLITEPKLIVMDEPTTLLDLRNARMIGNVIAELDQTVVLATHHLSLLRDFDRVLVFDGGNLVCDDVPAAAIAFYESLMQ